jgi:hypothetical protein
VPCAPPDVDDGALDCATARETENNVAAPISAILRTMRNSFVWQDGETTRGFNVGAQPPFR